MALPANGWPLKPPRPSRPRLCSRPARPQLKRMLEYDPSQRITAEEALQHPFFTGEPFHHAPTPQRAAGAQRAAAAAQHAQQAVLQLPQ